MSIAVLTESNFENEVLKSETPVLVDFWAPWCGPCRMVAPVLEEVDKEMGQKVKIAKLNVDDESQVAGKYKIMSIPTMVLFKKGEPVEKIIGARSKTELVDFIEKNA